MGVVVLLLWAAPAHAQRHATREALTRLEELLELARKDRQLDFNDVLPALLVRAEPKFDTSAGWFENAALRSLLGVFGDGSIRSCPSCSDIRARVESSRVEQSSGAVSMADVKALDDQIRGRSDRARSAIWISESDAGVSLRIVAIESGEILFAKNVSGDFWEQRRTHHNFQLSREIDRRRDGIALTHMFFDIGLAPMPHVDIEWNDQWGDTNANLTGVVFGIFDPVVGLGLSYHRILPWWDITVGAQMIVSLPSAVSRAINEEGDDLIDPILTGVLVARVPIFTPNYALLATVSTNGRVSFGISLLNAGLIPLLP